VNYAGLVHKVYSGYIAKQEATSVSVHMTPIGHTEQSILLLDTLSANNRFCWMNEASIAKACTTRVNNRSCYMNEASIAEACMN